METQNKRFCLHLYLVLVKDILKRRKERERKKDYFPLFDFFKDFSLWLVLWLAAAWIVFTSDQLPTLKSERTHTHAHANAHTCTYTQAYTLKRTQANTQTDTKHTYTTSINKHTRWNHSHTRTMSPTLAHTHTHLNINNTRTLSLSHTHTQPYTTDTFFLPRQVRILRCKDPEEPKIPQICIFNILEQQSN